jgi:protein NUD1
VRLCATYSPCTYRVLLPFRTGNPIGNDFIQDACYNLIYLELAACRLTVLPARFAALVPNVRVLNLNYNFLKDVQPLEGLARLRKLTIIGSRLAGTKALIRCVKGMPDVEMLDFRYV